MQAIVVTFNVDNEGNHFYLASCDAKTAAYWQDDIRAQLQALNIPITHETESLIAAQTLREQLDWNEQYYGKMIGGSLPNNKGYVYVFTGRKGNNDR